MFRDHLSPCIDRLCLDYFLFGAHEMQIISFCFYRNQFVILKIPSNDCKHKSENIATEYEWRTTATEWHSMNCYGLRSTQIATKENEHTKKYIKQTAHKRAAKEKRNTLYHFAVFSCANIVWFMWIHKKGHFIFHVNDIQRVVLRKWLNLCSVLQMLNVFFFCVAVVWRVITRFSFWFRPQFRSIVQQIAYIFKQCNVQCYSIQCPNISFHLK